MKKSLAMFVTLTMPIYTVMGTMVLLTADLF